MTVHIRPSEERGTASLGWLNSKHSFSFGHYFDPNHIGFGPLRVINEDKVVPGGGFPTHGHSNMEILSYVVDGALEHKDSMGTGSVIRPGDLQRMSAGSGVRHSEYNASNKDPVHFLQIWIVPEQEGLEPSYDQKSFPAPNRTDALHLLGSRDGRDGSLVIHQDVDLFGSLLSAGRTLSHDLKEGRGAWLQVVNGEVSLGDRKLTAGDGASVSQAGPLNLTAHQDAEFLLLDLKY